MNANSVNTQDGRKIGPVHLVWTGEMTFNAPIAEVWRHLINYPSWQNYTTAEHISGKKGAEGEVVLLKKEEPGFKFPSYHARTIKLEPPRWVIWKTYPGDADQEYDFFGIIQFRLDEVGKQTRFWRQSLYEFLVPHNDESELDEFRKQRYENTAAMQASIYSKLRALIEGGGGRVG